MSRGGEGGSASLFYINKFGQLELLLENLLKNYLVINLKIRTVGQLIVENTWNYTYSPFRTSIDLPYKEKYPWFTTVPYKP